MKLPDEEIRTFAPKVRNLTRHNINDIKVRTQTESPRSKHASCEIVLDIIESQRDDPRIDLIMVSGEYTDEIDRIGIESALTSENECLRSVAMLMMAFKNTKKPSSKHQLPVKGNPRRVPKVAEEDNDFDFDVNFDEDEDDEEEDCDF